MLGQTGKAAIACWMLLAGTALSSETLRHIQPDGRSLPTIVAGEGLRIYVAAQAGGSGDLEAQVLRAIGNVKIALAAAGATASDLVRLDIHLLKGGDPGTVRKILNDSFPAARAPNQLILPVAELLPAGSRVQIAALAVVGNAAGRRGVSCLNPPNLPNPHGSAAVSVARSRGLVYLSGQSDNAIGKHESITDMTELTRRSMQGLAIALKGARASFEDVANVVIYVSSLRQLEKLEQVYKSYFPAGKVPPTSYVPRAVADGAEPWVEIDAEAVVPAGTPAPARNEFINPEGLVASRLYSYVVRAAPGRTVYISAQVSTESRDSQGQARAVYERIQGLLRAAGSAFSDVVKVRVFLLPSGGTYQAINAVRTKLYDPNAAPASTLLAWDETATPEAQLQVDAVAVVPEK